MTTLLGKYRGMLKECVRYSKAAGFNVLRVEGDKVFVDFYCGKLDKPTYTLQVK